MSTTPAGDTPAPTPTPAPEPVPATAASTLDRLQAFAESVGADGDITIQWTSHQDWMVAAHWGHEAPDSPMAGAAAYGSASNVTASIEQALTDARFGPDVAATPKLKSPDDLMVVLDQHIRSAAQNRVNANEFTPGDVINWLAREAALQTFREAITGDTLELPDMTATMPSPTPPENVPDGTSPAAT